MLFCACGFGIVGPRWLSRDWPLAARHCSSAIFAVLIATLFYTTPHYIAAVSGLFSLISTLFRSAYYHVKRRSPTRVQRKQVYLSEWIKIKEKEWVCR